MSEIKIGKARPVHEIAKELADRLIRKREDDFMRVFCGVDWGTKEGDRTVTFTARRDFGAGEVVCASDLGDPDVIDVEFRDVTLPALPAKGSD